MYIFFLSFPYKPNFGVVSVVDWPSLTSCFFLYLLLFYCFNLFVCFYSLLDIFLLIQVVTPGCLYSESENPFSRKCARFTRIFVIMSN